VLNIEKVGIYDDFFELGGHSLLIVQLISRLQKIDFHIGIKDIFSDPTVAGISEKLSSTSTVYQVPANGITVDTDRITPEMIPLLSFDQEQIDTVVSKISGGVSNIQDMYPLSPLQEGMYFHYLMSDKEQGDPYVLPSLYSFSSKEKRTLFIKALQFVVNRHDVLRTCILSEGLPQPVQVVLREVVLEVEELDLDLADLQLLTAPGNQWMDVSKAPLFELKSADDPRTDSYYLISNQHHLVFDHVGLEMVVSEVYAYLSGEASSLPKPTLYRDFIGHTLHQKSVNDSESYFKELLNGVEEPSYPFNLSDIQGTGSDIRELQSILPKQLSKEIREVSITLGMSPAVVFHAAYGLVISTCSNSDYALFGSLFSGRLQGASAAVDSLGLFINTLPFYISLEGNVLEYVKEVKQKLGALLPYEQTPLSDIHGWSEVSNEVPLFSAILNYRHSSTATNEENPFDLGLTIISDHERTNYPFTLNVDDFGDDFKLTAQIDTSIDAERVLAYMQTALEQLLEGLKSENTAIVRLTILPEEELQTLERFNGIEVDYGTTQTVLDYFKDQVEAQPEALAVVYQGVGLTYEELDVKSNQLAHYLQDKGIKSGDFVGICIERSLEMLVGILGVLKSGGAYVPIDPNYPQDRVDYMIEDTATGLVLSSAQNRTILEHKKDIIIVLLDSDWDAIASYSTSGLETKIAQSDLAYVIYTSGSTGKPKGVLIEHGNMFNLVNWALDNFEESLELGMLASTSINFDLSIFELFTSLASGAKIELVDNLLSLVEDSDISVSLINTVPSVLLGVLDSGKLPETVKTVNLAGEPLLPSLVDRIYAESSVESVYDLYGPSEATT
ncbi:AMP-binding protein, partial [Tenacibaculum agarivorans]|uniref:AMP-binding protein n=1 Tax=Tenacibaculum agarivorans TaxID=1908389 RepID=UPI00094BC052